MPTSDDDLSPLVHLAGGGDELAFSELFRRYYARLRAFAWRMVFDSQAAEDIVQETFIRTARQMHTLRDGRAFEGWLFRITANLARDHIRTTLSHERKLAAAALESPARQNDGSLRVEQALQTLPQAQREAVALVYYEGFNHADAARRLGCAEATISWRIMLAKRTLKKYLSHERTGNISRPAESPHRG